ncbi:NAD(P)H-binding protein [Streptomyces sp. LX-29]|uniref:NAD(P)H-binding protein n=1 Tax=Streptomyces sp. LX-29 TaxID=2900152 RepID=UPI00240D1EF2|nr:NAD(P)H-binding protein [Streptomyces sp. LX-29]WFB06416.1 NAD(P)H-binding protein [Streptomyces sp. LX-29]
MNARTALLAGATGLVGGQVLSRLLADPLYERVTVLSRRPLEVSHAKLDVRIVDFAALAEDDVPAVEDVYITLGTTMKAAGSRQAFRAVDHHHVVTVARLARLAGARRIALCSAIGASPTARAFYLRVKGEAERDVVGLEYASTHIFRPSLLLGARAESRPAERLGVVLAPVFAPLLAGPLRPYRPVRVERLAAAMTRTLATAGPGTRVHTYGDFVTA